MKLRIGVVGLGAAWEHRHRPALRTLADRFEIRAVCDEVSLRAEQAAREFSASVVDGFRALVVRDDVDAVLLLAPQWYGALPILAACEAGKAIYCASALDIEPREAVEVKRRVEEAGVAFMAELPRRHAAATIRLKELIATRLGKPRILFCHQRLSMEPPTGRKPRAQHNSLAMQYMMELVDWCRYVVGSEPGSVVGIRHLAVDPDAGDDYRMMSLDFSPADCPGIGAVAQISCGRYMPARWHEAISFRPPSGLQVCCEKGIAFVDLPASLVWFDEAGRQVESLESERPVGEHMLTQFHRAVTSLVRKTSDLEDAYRALQSVLSAEISCREGRRVALEF